MKANVTPLAIAKTLATNVLIAIALFCHSTFYILLSLALVLALWLKEMGRLRLVAALCIAGLLAGMVLTMSARGFDLNRRMNLLVDTGDSITTPSVGAWLLDALAPENLRIRFNGWDIPVNNEKVMSGYGLQLRDAGRPVYVRQPAHVRGDMDYHVVLMPQGEHGCLLAHQQGLEWLDSCIVVTLGTRDTSGHYTGSDLAAFTLRVLPALRRLGYQIDRRYVSVVDNSGDGSLAQTASQAPGDVFRNIVRLNSPVADASTLPCSQARQVMVGNRREYQRAYTNWSNAGLDTDHLAADATIQSQQATVADVLSGRLGVPLSRIEKAHELASQFGYDDQFVMFVDYSIPSGKYRFFLYDYAQQRIIVRSKCAHGCGPGNTEAVPVFSNEFGSQCTSLGNYAVHNVHAMFKNGRIAITMDGLDPTNSNATARGIKMHSGMRMEGEIYPRYLKLGKLSEGCVALGNIPFALVCGIVNSCDRPILMQSYR